jgi:hypothetical protein
MGHLTERNGVPYSHETGFRGSAFHARGTFPGRRLVTIATKLLACSLV